MRVSAKVDYALRAMAELAAAPPGLMTADQLASAQHIPPKFLESILSQLRSAGLIASQRGAEGGYQLARPAEEISIAEVIRELEGPIATVRGVRPDERALHRFHRSLRRVGVARFDVVPDVELAHALAQDATAASSATG